MLMNRKGSMFDNFYLLVVFFVVSLVFLVINMVFNVLQTSNLTAGMTAVDNFQDGVTGYNYSGLFIIIGLGLGAIVFASTIKTNPGFAVFSLIFLAIIVYLSGIFGNVYGSIAGSGGGAMVTSAEDFSLITRAFQNLPLILSALGFVIFIVLYRRGGEGL